MKFPLFNFDIFKRSTTPTNRVTTTFGHRKHSSSHRSKSASSRRRTTRKRSITYYSPSKSRFYPTEYFPSLQRHPPAVSCDAKKAALTATNKLNHNQTYLCSDQDFIVHHDAAWLTPQLPHQNKQIDPQFYTASELCEQKDRNNNDRFVQKSNDNRDYHAAHGIAVDDNVDAIVDAPANQYGRYTKECMGASSSMFVMPDSQTNGNFYGNFKCESLQQRPSFLRTIPPTGNHVHANHGLLNNRSRGVIGATAFDGASQYTNSPCFPIFHHSTIPIMKKHERHRRRKVCVVYPNVTVL